MQIKPPSASIQQQKIVKMISNLQEQMNNMSKDNFNLHKI